MKPVAAPFPISLRPSRRLALAQAAAHIVAAGAVLASALPAWLAALLAALVGASLARQRGRKPVAGLVLRGEGRIETVGADGATDEAAIHPHTLVLAGIVVLLYRQRGRLRALTLLSDSLDAEAFRQLRLWLRWRAASAAAAGSVP